MYCEYCRVRIPFDKAPELTNCALCGRTLKADVSDVFKHGKFGIIKEQRETQISMALQIEKFLNIDKGTFLIEGGTGIGKSFAYLIPALLSEGKRVIVSTAKKTLQDQLATKDVPILLEKMGLKNLRYSLYKGKGNYACWKLAQEVPLSDRKRFDKFIGQAQARGTPADIANWKGVVPYWWSKISIDNCVLGANCPHIANCKPHPKQDALIITNHHLVAIDMKTTTGMLFGPYNLLILDEAHQAREAFRSVNSKTITARTLELIEKTVANDENFRGVIDDSGVSTARAMVQSLADLKSQFKKAHDAAISVADSGGTFDGSKVEEPLTELRQQADTIGGRVFLLMGGLQKAYEATLDGGRSLDSGDASPEELIALLGRAHRLHKKLIGVSDFVATISQAAGSEEKDDTLTTCDDRGLHLQPVELGPIVGPKLRTIKHKMVLSATLAMGDDFSFIKNDLGLQSKDGSDVIWEEIYPSPFNLDKQAVLYIPRHLPLPAHMGMPEERGEWIRAITKEIAQLIGATQGDCFVLFSARSDMNSVIEELGQFFWDDAKLNLVLHEGEATATLDEFKRTPNAVLFGLKSFWEGVDIVGDKLKLVIIPKLPFPNPNDPLIKALNTKAGTGSFFAVSIPNMVFDMKQGVGRLIRTQSDRGCIAILDVRVWTGTGDRAKHARRMELIEADPNRTRIGYGKKLLDTLGFKKITDDFTIFKKFVNKFFSVV